MSRKSRKRKKRTTTKTTTAATTTPTTTSKLEVLPSITSENISIEIPSMVHEKIYHWMGKKDKEVSGFGWGEWTGSSFVVRDAVLLKQKVTGAETEIDPNAIGKLEYLWREKPNALKWHWHSHVNMNVFWSGTDMEFIRELGYQGWQLATVFNLRGESRSAFMSTMNFMGEKYELFLDDLETKIITEIPSEVIEQWDKEFDENVEEKWSGSTYYSGNYYGRYSGSFYDRSYASSTTPAAKESSGSTIYYKGKQYDTTPEALDELIEEHVKDSQQSFGITKRSPDSHDGWDDPILWGRGATVIDPEAGPDDDDDDYFCESDDWDEWCQYEVNRKHTYSKWDESGYRTNHTLGVREYNPFKDKSIENRAELYEEVLTMPKDELHALRAACPEFAKEYTKLLNDIKKEKTDADRKDGGTKSPDQTA